MKLFIEKIKYPVLIIALGILIFGVVVTYNHISIDDPAYVFDNPYLKNLVSGNLLKFFFQPYANMVRPLDSLVYLIEYELWGFSNAGYHFTNLLFHITNSILVFVLLGFFIEEKPYRFLASTIFLLSPVQVETVAWISEQKSTLSTMFLLIGIISYIKLRQEHWRAGKWITLLCFISGMLVKPNIVIFPVLLVWYDFIYVKQPIFKNIMEKYYLWIPSFIVGVVYLFFVHKTGFTTTMFGGNIYTHILTTISNIAGIAQYPLAIIFPFYIHMIAYPDHPITQMLSLHFLTSIFFLFIFGYYSYYAYKHKQHTILFFIGWYYINFLLASGIIPIAYQGAVRYLYIPMIGPSVLFVLSIKWLYKLITKKIIITSALLLVLCSYVAIDFVSVRAWKSELSFWKYQVWTQPNNGRDRVFLADTLVAHHDFDSAISQASKAVTLSPYDPVVWSQVFNVYYKTSMYVKAIETLKNFHNVLIKNYGDVDPALIPDSGVGYDIRSYYFLLYSYYADVYFKILDFNSSLNYSKKALTLHPADDRMFALETYILLSQHESNDVISLSNNFKKIKPDSSTGYLMAALAYEQLGKLNDAIENIDRAISLCNDNARRGYMLQKRREIHDLLLLH